MVALATVLAMDASVVGKFTADPLWGCELACRRLLAPLLLGARDSNQERKHD